MTQFESVIEAPVEAQVVELAYANIGDTGALTILTQPPHHFLDG